MHPIVPGVPDPEDLVDVLRQLTEAFLGLAPCVLGPLALVGHDAAPGPVQGFAQAADERADQHEEASGRPRRVLGPDGMNRAVRQEVVRGRGAEQGGQEPGQKPPRYAAIMTAGKKVMYRALSPSTGMRCQRAARSETAVASKATP